ncbi:DEAD/DEAH box helicase [Clostridium guangxiense]|uniref:DEAD/DEAH box helicase n=1 Tax=Clostridium guangxiense TaxID=1662055 RepID=UPI001E3DBB36|nr:AAA family ATPase [Clostridium guangxiense]MCD2346850.1 AAA family ATPase [Clostridium guangxiense]
MSDSLFYCDIENGSKISEFISAFKEYSQKESKQVYIIKKALGTTNDYDYDYDDEAIILVPKHKIIVINYGIGDSKNFEHFLEDFTQDLGYLSDKFSYKKILGRPREWQKLIISEVFHDGMVADISDFLKDKSVESADERKIDLLISLLIGSINDIEKLGLENPETLLDKVKKKIILFDGMQSRFIYEKVDKSQVIIQGLAGTGKTELLLHKLRETYIKIKNSRIVFTCFNKVLADDMKNRIPRFFNFMKVEEQIEWDSRLWVFSSWGSQSVPNSGLYSYICSKYGLQFKRFSYINTFDKVCEDACEQLKLIENLEPCFDYIFIDESQDFSQSFFDLCSLVTKVRIYIAGDIFQNIFDMNIENSVECDYLLNKCYRTDPKTLMFAHSIGMGLYEKPVIRWLEDREWESCGYEYERKNGKFILSRTPIRRFEDVESINSIQLRGCSIDYFTEEILTCIDEIRQNNSTVSPDDIAVVFVGNTKNNYEIADSLMVEIDKKYNWEINKGYITKTKVKDQLFVSNTNNIKGLEFPFVICVETSKITDRIHQRNSIYMILTRSFLTSYFIVNSDNTEFIEIYKNAIDNINKDGFMKLREPDKKEKEEQEEKIKIMAQAKKKSVEDIINQVCKEDYPKLSRKYVIMLYNTIPTIIENESEEEVITKTRGMIKVILGD